MIVPSGARTYDTSSLQGIRLGAVIGEAPSAIALANEAETSRVRKAISTPAGCPSTGRLYPSGINILPSEWAAMARVEPPVSNSANPSASSKKRSSSPNARR
jgi:hypothetical protein